MYMRLVSFFYPSTEVKLSINFLLYFKLVGIYILEVQTDSTIGERNDEAILSADAIVYLMHEDDNNTICPNEETKLVTIDCRIAHRESEYDFLLNILHEFFCKKIIDENEFDDLKLALQIFCEFNSDYLNATFLGKYYFEHQLKKRIYEIHSKYSTMGIEFMNTLKKHNIPIWGENKYIHCRYAFINILFDFDLFCKKNRLNYYIEANSLCNACSRIDSECGNFLGNSFKVLEAQIYEQLLEDVTKAFQLYVDCCDNNYDAYVYFCKGEMMYRKKEMDRAVNYYIQGTSYYPQYYRAWFKLGLCSLGKDDNQALSAFNNVIRILDSKYENNVLRAIEFEYFYNSYMNIADIERRLGNYRNALSACNEALKTYKSVYENIFYSILKIDKFMDYKEIRSDILSHLDIQKLKKDGIELSIMLDLKDNALLYAEL